VTRCGGVFIMSFVKISPRVESFINTMASSVLIAIIVPMAVSGDAGALAALVATAVTMLAIRKPLPAISVGLLAAALVRFLGYPFDCGWLNSVQVFRVVADNPIRLI